MGTKVVINACFGGFSLSEEACRLLDCSPYDYKESEKRSDPSLVHIVETLGEKANGSHASLKIVEIPGDCVDWHITEYDGSEHVAERHRTWY